jgi:hypothetical protein
MNLDSSSVEVEPPIDPNRFILDGVVETSSDEVIRLYSILILNPSLDETFKIEEMRRNRRRVQLKVNRKIKIDEILTRQKKLPELCGNSVLFAETRLPNTIRVSELSNNCTKEILNLYFSNSKFSQGGDIKLIKMFSHENKALIQFKNYSVCDDVLSRLHIICEHTVKIEKYYGPIEEEYFREEEEIETSQLMLEKSINIPRNLKSLKSQVSNIDKTKLIISNIQENISLQQLDFYIQLITHRAEINEINWSLEHKGKLIIDFKKEMDINHILDEFQQQTFNNLNGKSIQLETVNVTRTLVVLVKDIRSRYSIVSRLDTDAEDYRPEMIPATRDLLELYFVNKLRSGGGEVESIERKSSRYWLIVMKDQRSIKDILSRRHVIDEKPIKLFPYFENFGLPYLFKPIFDEHSSSTSLPSVFKLKIKDERLRYFCKVKTLHKKLNDILSESNAVSRYNKQESNILYVSYIQKLETKVPYMERIWRLRVKESIEYFLQVYKYEKLTLSFNQWATISKTKSISETLFSKPNYEQDDLNENDIDSEENGTNKVKYIGNNLAIISINETNTNVEITIVGPNYEVDKFIVKIKDIICKAYFTFELEEKIIKFKTYLFECEELLAKWLSAETNDGIDSDTEVVLASAKVKDSDSVSISYLRKSEGGGVKLNKSRQHTIDEFLSKLERDHLDMELSYGKLFQELGYTFLTQAATQSPTEEDDDEYKDFNGRLESTLDEVSSIIHKNETENESQMDKIKFTLDDLRNRINDMRKKFRQFTIKAKRQTAAVKNQDDVDSDLDDDENESQFKLCVYVKEQSKLLTFSVNPRCQLRDLKKILFEKLNESKSSIDDMILTFGNSELTNDSLTLQDYGIVDKSTITLEFDR